MNIKLKAFIAFFVIFLAGLGTGMLIKDHLFPISNGNDRISWVERERGERPLWGERQRGERPGREMIRRHLSQRLDLEEEQTDLFLSRLGEYRSEIREMIRELREDEREMLKVKYNEFRADMSDLLNEEQLRRLDSFAHPDSVRSPGFQRMRGQGGNTR